MHAEVLGGKWTVGIVKNSQLRHDVAVMRSSQFSCPASDNQNEWTLLVATLDIWF